MSETNKPTQIEDADLDMAGGALPDMKIRKAATSVALDGDVTMGVRKAGLRDNGIRAHGVRVGGVRVGGIRKKG